MNNSHKSIQNPSFLQAYDANKREFCEISLALMPGIASLPSSRQMPLKPVLLLSGSTDSTRYASGLSADMVIISELA